MKRNHSNSNNNNNNKNIQINRNVMNNEGHVDKHEFSRVFAIGIYFYTEIICFVFVFVDQGTIIYY